MSALPIEAVLPELKLALAAHHQVVLEAPPGAGKTTLAPLALLQESWLEGQRILMLEPRRLAARAAAERMAQLLGEPVGDTVGYRVRLDSKVSKNTRIEVVTEGILTRYLQNDPSLDGVGLVIFDEFHERSLDADLGLALALNGRQLFRDPADGATPLKLLVMSATLDGANVADLLGEKDHPAPIVRSEGRQYPVQVHYHEPWQAGEAIAPRVINCVRQVLVAEQGSLLVFLPGQREIRQVQQGLEDVLGDNPDIILAPLYGDLSLADQHKAIEPAPKGQRKIVLATAIAESSLTIKGVTVVVDGGLSRMPVFDPNTGMTRLDTRRLSRAASVQRMGRAGRLQPGSCYRLWSASQQDQLPAFTPPEMQQADLAPLALQLQRWGVEDVSELEWLDPPPTAPYQQALELLEKLGAVAVKEGIRLLTPHGEAMACLPSHPRLAHMLILGERYGLRQQACDLATLLSERDPLNSDSAEIQMRLDLLRGDRRADSRQRHIVQRMRRQSQQFQYLCKQASKQLAGELSAEPVDNADDEKWLGFLLACAYPDRIGQRRDIGNDRKTDQSLQYRLSNGRAASLLPSDGLQRHSWLVAAHLGGHRGQATDRIFMAAALEPELFDDYLTDLVTTRERVSWDKQRERFVAEQQRRIGKLVLSSKALRQIDPEAKARVLLELVRNRGLGLLSWTDTLRQWQGRVNLLRQLDLEQGDSSEWPDLSDSALLATIEEWLAPYLTNINHLDDFARLDLANILLGLLPWPLPQQLDQLAPERVKVPSGSRIAIDYSQSPPVLAVRLQEMFGCEVTPSIANGRLPLMLHLLSPARRPLQVTQDLVSFWGNSYADVKKDMKGRYPKHYWPDNPLQAEATARAKPRKS